MFTVMYRSHSLQNNKEIIQFCLHDHKTKTSFLQEQKVLYGKKNAISVILWQCYFIGNRRIILISSAQYLISFSGIQCSHVWIPPKKPLATTAVMVAKQQQSSYFSYISKSQEMNIREGKGKQMPSFIALLNKSSCFCCMCVKTCSKSPHLQIWHSPPPDTHNVAFKYYFSPALKHSFINTLKFKTHRKVLCDCQNIRPNVLCGKETELLLVLFFFQPTGAMMEIIAFHMK